MINNNKIDIYNDWLHKKNLPKGKSIPVTVSKVGGNGKKLHHQRNNSQAFTALGIVKFQDLWYLDFKMWMEIINQ